MFCRAVAKRAGVYLAVFMLPLLTAVLSSATAQIIGPPPVICEMVGEGTLPTGDAFVGQVTVNAGGFGSGTWIHFTPDRSVPGQGGGACVLIERMCTRLGAAGLTTSYCTAPAPIAGPRAERRLHPRYAGMSSSWSPWRRRRRATCRRRRSRSMLLFGS